MRFESLRFGECVAGQKAKLVKKFPDLLGTEPLSPHSFPGWISRDVLSGRVDKDEHRLWLVDAAGAVNRQQAFRPELFVKTVCFGVQFFKLQCFRHHLRIGVVSSLRNYIRASASIRKKSVCALSTGA